MVTKLLRGKRDHVFKHSLHKKEWHDLNINNFLKKPINKGINAIHTCIILGYALNETYNVSPLYILAATGTCSLENKRNLTKSRLIQKKKFLSKLFE